MTKSRHFERVKESAEALGELLNGSSNLPLEDYLPLEDAKALSNALSIDPNDMVEADLERLILIRDGLYDLVSSARDKGDGSEHGTDILINAVSRLYVDVERAFRSGDASVTTALADVVALRNTSNVILNSESQASIAITSEANAVITQTNITHRHISFNLININGNLNILKEIRVQINRLSASVFAVKMQFQAGIIFEGTIKFLNDGVDKILDSIREFAESISTAYRSAKDMLEALNPLIEKGTRFVKLIGNFITDFFSEADSKRVQR